MNIYEKKDDPVVEANLEILEALHNVLGVLIEEHYEVKKLRAEADYWQKEHAKLLNQSIKHGEEMMGNLLRATIEGKLTNKK